MDVKYIVIINSPQPQVLTQGDLPFFAYLDEIEVTRRKHILNKYDWWAFDPDVGESVHFVG